MKLNASWAAAWIKGAASAIEEHREELTELDRAIGDADHGENMDRGFQAAAAKVRELDSPDTPAAILKVTATTLISTVGGASGPLVGTAFLRASKEANVPELGAEELVDVLSAALGGIQARGKAAEGEKTMVDAWAPAVQAAQDAADAGKDLAEVLRAAAEGAARGAKATEPMQATKGRASYLGDRSCGHLDPGAVSASYILAAAVDAAEAQSAEGTEGAE